MKTKHKKTILTWNTVLVVAVFLCAFVIPVIPVTWGNFPARIGFTLIYISGVLISEKTKWYFLYLALASFIMEWVSGTLDLGFLLIVSQSLSILFFLFVIGSLIREMATAKVVTTRVIMASISGYLLLGIVFSVMIAAIIQHDREAFNISWNNSGPGTARAHLSETMYFGMITLATVGYGDIVPLKPYARSLSTLIAISGQLYVATIIGILIGKYASGSGSAEK